MLFLNATVMQHRTHHHRMIYMYICTSIHTHTHTHTHHGGRGRGRGREGGEEEGKRIIPNIWLLATDELVVWTGFIQVVGIRLEGAI